MEMTPEAIKALRERLGLSQVKFAMRYGFGMSTVRDWEHGRRKPQGLYLALLQKIERGEA